MNTMSTLSLFTSQILLWNYLFPLALEKKKKKKQRKNTHAQHLLNYSSQSASPEKQNWGRKKGGERGRVIHSVSLAYEKKKDLLLF